VNDDWDDEVPYEQSGHTPLIFEGMQQPFSVERLKNILSLLTSRKFLVSLFAVLTMFGLEISDEMQAAIISLITLGLVLTIAWEDVGKAQSMLSSTTFLGPISNDDSEDY